jgi:hypothetical protein
MQNKKYYTLTIDGKEMVKSTSLSEVAINTPHVEDHYEINQMRNGKVLKKWGYSVNPVNGEKTMYSSHTDTRVKPPEIPDKMKKAVTKINCLGKRVGGIVSTLKREYKVRKNLKLLEKKVELFDF